MGGAKVIKFLTFNTALLGHDYTHLQLELNGNSSSPVLNVTVINASDLKAYKSTNPVFQFLEYLLPQLHLRLLPECIHNLKHTKKREREHKYFLPEGM